MKDILDKIEKKVEKLDEKLDVVNTHLAVYNEQLKIHIKRSELLEDDIKPIKSHVSQVKGAIKFLTLTATVLSIILAILAFTGK